MCHTNKRRCRRPDSGSYLLCREADVIVQTDRQLSTKTTTRDSTADLHIIIRAYIIIYAYMHIRQTVDNNDDVKIVAMNSRTLPVECRVGQFSTIVPTISVRNAIKMKSIRFKFITHGAQISMESVLLFFIF